MFVRVCAWRDHRKVHKIIEDVGSVKSYNKYSVLFSGLVIPGGGCFMLREYDEGKGIVATVSLLMLVSSWGKVINKDLSSNRFYHSEANSFLLSSLTDPNFLN